MSILELPFTLMFIITIAIIGGKLALIPLLLACCYFLLALIMLPRIQAATDQGAAATVRKQALLVETMQKNRLIKAHGLGSTWWKRFHKLSGEAAITSFSSAFLSSLIEAIAYGLSIIAGVSTLTFGIWLVWHGSITVHSVIAYLKVRDYRMNQTLRFADTDINVQEFIEEPLSAGFEFNEAKDAYTYNPETVINEAQEPLQTSAVKIDLPTVDIPTSEPDAGGGCHIFDERSKRFISTRRDQELYSVTKLHHRTDR